MVSSILIADDQMMLSRGLRKILQNEMQYSDVECVTTCSGTLKALKERKRSHLILEMGLADGSALEIIPNIKLVYPATKILVYTVKPVEIYGDKLRALEVYFYLSKLDDLDGTIRYLDIFLSEVKAPDNYSNVAVESPFSGLTPRHLDVARYLLLGLGGNQIAKNLNLSSDDVVNFKNQIYERTGAKDKMDLLRLAKLHNMC